jgi:phage-related protein
MVIIMRDLVFMGDSLDTMRSFPDDVKREMGYALRFAQEGKTHDKAKPLRGYPGVWEIVSPHMKETYRAIYALKIGRRIYVLHAFQKKSKHGIKTPRSDLEMIAVRYKAAKRLEEEDV